MPTEASLISVLSSTILTRLHTSLLVGQPSPDSTSPVEEWSRESCLMQFQHTSWGYLVAGAKFSLSLNGGGVKWLTPEDAFLATIRYNRQKIPEKAGS